jgi:hypothetical protein
VRWLAGNGADTALEGLRRVEAKAVCALNPSPTAKTLARHCAALVKARLNPFGPTACKPAVPFPE